MQTAIRISTTGWMEEYLESLVVILNAVLDREEAEEDRRERVLYDIP